MSDMETIVKGLQEGLAETRQDVKELQSAMVGSVDGTRKGFAQQLLKVMEAMEAFTARMGLEEGRLGTVENKLTRFEGTISGAKTAVVAFWAVIGLTSGVLLTLLVRK